MTTNHLKTGVEPTPETSSISNIITQRTISNLCSCNGFRPFLTKLNFQKFQFTHTMSNVTKIHLVVPGIKHADGQSRPPHYASLVFTL
jgi:hypothetical protein